MRVSLACAQCTRLPLELNTRNTSFQVLRTARAMTDEILIAAAARSFPLPLARPPRAAPAARVAYKASGFRHTSTHSTHQSTHIVLASLPSTHCTQAPHARTRHNGCSHSHAWQARGPHSEWRLPAGAAAEATRGRAWQDEFLLDACTLEASSDDRFREGEPWRATIEVNKVIVTNTRYPLRHDWNFCDFIQNYTKPEHADTSGFVR